MKILTTGSNGMLGQDMCPVLEDVGAFVIETDIDEMDVTNLEQVERVITDSHPDMVVHMAAYTDVEKAESEKQKAIEVNIDGTRNIAKVCGEKDIPLIYISTDYVFDGEKKTPYEPEDATKPLNHYGWTKLQGEEAVRACKKHYIARTSWLYGHHGESFVSKVLMRRDEDVIKVVDDQISCPTWTIELANGVLKLLQKPFGTYHVCGGGAVSRYTFSKEVYKAFGLDDSKIVPCMTYEQSTEAKRPMYSAMNNHGLCRDWQTALKDFVLLSDV